LRIILDVDQVKRRGDDPRCAKGALWEVRIEICEADQANEDSYEPTNYYDRRGMVVRQI
jgi:hypothetical protein